MYSDMFRVMTASSVPKRNSARARALSVLPTPEGPRNRKEPMGRLGSFEPGPGPAHGAGQGADGGVLADHPLVQDLLHAGQAVLLLPGDLPDGDAGLLVQGLGDVAGVHLVYRPGPAAPAAPGRCAGARRVRDAAGAAPAAGRRGEERRLREADEGAGPAQEADGRRRLGVGEVLPGEIVGGAQGGRGDGHAVVPLQHRRARRQGRPASPPRSPGARSAGAGGRAAPDPARGAARRGAACSSPPGAACPPAAPGAGRRRLRRSR